MNETNSIALNLKQFKPVGSNKLKAANLFTFSRCEFFLNEVVGDWWLGQSGLKMQSKMAVLMLQIMLYNMWWTKLDYSSLLTA